MPPTGSMLRVVVEPWMTTSQVMVQSKQRVVWVCRNTWKVNKWHRFCCCSCAFASPLFFRSLPGYLVVRGIAHSLD